jgi:hypothetical protein
VIGGYSLGSAAERLFANIEKFEQEVLLAALLVAIVATVVLRIRRSRQHKPAGEPH